MRLSREGFFVSMIDLTQNNFYGIGGIVVSNDFNASLVISTSEAVQNVRNVDGAAKDLDKTLAHLHTTMVATQGDLDKVAGSLKTFTATQRQANADQKTRADLLIKESKLEREGIINKSKNNDELRKQTQHEAKLAGIRGRSGRASVSALGSETRRNAESENKMANLSILTNARATTEAERRAAAEQVTAAAIARRAAAEDRAALTAMRLANATSKHNNANLELNDSLSNSRYLLYDVGQTYAVLSAALLAIPAATAAVATSYEKDFAQVIRTTGIAGEEVPELRNELKALGREIPLTFGQFSNIASIAGQLGIAKGDIADFTETVAKFGAASNVSIDEASTAFGRLQNSFDPLRQQEDFFNKIGSSIAKVGVESAASETEIIAVTNQISAAGAQSGFTADQIVGLSGALASVRIRPELARGAFQRIMLGLSRSADQGAESFEQFGKYTGLAADQSLELFKSDPSAFFYKYIGGIKATVANGASLSSVLDDIGAKNVFDKQFILGLVNGYEVYGKALGDASSAFQDGTFLDESTKGTFETFAATLTKLGTSLSNLADSLGKGSLTPLTDMAETVLNLVNGFDRLITQEPAIGVVINTLMLLGTVTGVLLAFKSAQAFVLAGLVGLQQVMGKTAIAGALSLRGNVAELAKTMLMSKGATAQAAQAYVSATTPMRAMGAAATATRAQVAGLNTTMAASGTATMAAGASTGRAASGFKSLAGSILGLAGGPIGVLLLGMGAIITTMISAGEEAAQAGDAIARAMQNGSDAVVRSAATALAAIKVKWTDAIAVGNMDRTLVEVAEDAGVSFDKLALAATKGRDAGKEVLKVMNEVAQNKGFKDFADLQANSFGSQNKAGQLEFLRKTVERIGNESGKTADGLKAVDKASGAAGEAAANAAPSVEGLDGALDDTGESADKAAQAIQKAVDAIFGLVNAEAATQGALQRLGEGLFDSTSFSPGDEGGRENLSNLQDTLRNAALEQQQLIDSGEQTAQEAAGNYVAFIDGLFAELAAKGVDVSQIQGMANQAKGIFGETFATGEQPVITPKIDSSPVITEAVSLNEELRNFVAANKTVFSIDADTGMATTEVTNMVNGLAEITGYPYQVVLDALTDPAHAKSEEIYNLLTSITDGTYVAPVGADTSVAISNIQSFANYARAELSTLQNDYNNLLNQARNGKGFFKTSAQNILGMNSDGTGQDHFGPSQKAAPIKASAPRISTPSRAPVVAQPNFGGLQNGYGKAAKAAEKAGEAGKKAGEDMANGIDDATRAVDDYASRLSQGLKSAFDKQYGLQTATDAYHTTLNSIKKKREDELKQLDELVEKQKELNNARSADLINARKAGIEKNISLKYGEFDRAADYAAQEKEALDAADAKQKDIAANKDTATSLKEGIGKLDGYSQAAIDNRAALRDLEGKMVDMIVAYAATGKSADEVRDYTDSMTRSFKLDADQMFTNRHQVGLLGGDFSRYIDVVNKVPQFKNTRVGLEDGAARQGLSDFNGAADFATRPRDMFVKATYMGGLEEIPGQTVAGGQQVYRVRNPDGTIAPTKVYNRGGEVKGFATGGLIPGQAPSDPRKDNLLASVDGKGQVMVRSGEFIVQQPAVDYWGLDMFKQLNNMKMPAFNAGGSVGAGRGGAASSNGPVLVELTAENIQAIIRSAERPISLYTSAEKIASTANEGNKILASKGVR